MSLPVSQPGARLRRASPGVRAARCAARLVGVVGALALLGCNALSPHATGAPAPTCSCPCTEERVGALDERAPAAGPPPAVARPAPVSLPTPQDTAPPDVAELVGRAHRRMMHGDGQACLDDLEALARLDRRAAVRLAVLQAQCEMLVGRCQQGKARIARWYEEELAMAPDRAANVAESMASLRCRDGDSTDRDRLLVALQELMDGAYMSQRAPAWCQERVERIVHLAPRVPTDGPDDHTLRGGKQALFHTAASCFARAGDCAAAFRVYREHFPQAGLAPLDPAMRAKVVRDAFASSIPRCATEGGAP